MRKRIVWGSALVVIGVALCFVPIGAYCLDGADFGYCDTVRLTWVGVPIVVVGIVVTITGVARRPARGRDRPGPWSA
jgi:hypothetical protein